MNAIQMRRCHVRDEELAAAGIFARMRHGKRARRMLLAVDFAFDVISWTTPATAFGTSTLDHKILDDAVKIESVVKAAFGEFHEIRDGSRSVLIEKFQVNRALAGFHDGL